MKHSIGADHDPVVAPLPHKLLEIVTPTQTFKNTPSDKMWFQWFQFLCIQAKYENDKKGVDVKRGMRRKAEMCIYPSPAPTGYINVGERGMKAIKVDPERFPLLRKAVDLMLTGAYTPTKILDLLNNGWEYRTPRGNKLSRSTRYYLFTRPFYYGTFEYPVGSGNWHRGTHEPLMSESEYRMI